MKESILNVKDISYLNPLFWQHGECEKVLRNEIIEMKKNGIGSFVVEARPHPEYLNEGWWHDLSILIAEAKRQDMKVWLFDDGDYPSGNANGIIAKKYPQYLKKYMIEDHIDATGPLDGASFLINDWLQEGEVVLKIIASKRYDRNETLIPETFIDITEKQFEGRLYWNLPEGEWRIFIIKKSPYGQEKHTMNHLNPLEKEATLAFINEVYEEHYKIFHEEFGKTISGFFTDEPRFGNIEGYDKTLGKCKMPLPYCDGLLEQLTEQSGIEFDKILPCLWYDSGDLSVDARYIYMDTVSRLFGENFVGQMGDWCRNHNVKLIGHLVEENGAHARLGYGAGHFFRALEGCDASGLDIVCNLLPEQTSGHYTTCFNYFGSDFNHWGLSKMASSAAHIDPKKNGVTICEAFGAYGWFEGLKLMKWITDVITVRGVNHIVPHAFSPKSFPDPDCPPHFYAGGENPQWRNFKVWADYTNRICHLITGGIHIASAAVLYHAEAEWGGAYEPFEKTVKLLMQNQIDCDVIPADVLIDEDLCFFKNGELTINKETYKVFIVPYSEYLPKHTIERLNYFAQQGLTVIFLHQFPKRCYFTKKCDTSHFLLCGHDSLIKTIVDLGYLDISLEHKDLDACYYHYKKEDTDVYFIVNESTKNTIDTTVTFNITKNAYLYDPMSGEKYKANQLIYGCESKISLYLQPYESVFIIFDDETVDKERVILKQFENARELNNSWSISLATAEHYPNFVPCNLNTLGNISTPDKFPDFSGTIKYQTSFFLDKPMQLLLDLGKVYELANVTVNGVILRGCICPPYQIQLPESILKAGENHLIVEVTNTLVKQQHNNLFDKYFVQEPSGLIGPVRLLY